MPEVDDAVERVAVMVENAETHPPGGARELVSRDLVRRVLNAHAALRSSQPREEGDETGWLIEEPHGPHWIALAENIWKHGWYISERDQPSPVRRVKDSNDAIRFSRKQDAEAFMDLFERFLLCPVATEHSWITTPIEQENTEERVHPGPEMERIMRSAAFEATEHQYEAQSRSPVEDALVEKVARAISGTQWDRACSALGTPNYPRGDNWSALLPEARAAIEALSKSSAIDPRVAELVEAATTAKRALEIVNETLQRMEGVTCANTAEVVRRLDTALAAFGGKTE